MTDPTLAWLFITGLILLATDLVITLHHARAARSRRSPVVLFGTEGSDEGR